MRIGILSQWYGPETGAATVPTVLAQALARRGHEIQVVTGFPNYPTGKIAPGYKVQRRLDETDGHGVTIRRVALYPNHGVSVGKRFLNYSSFAMSATLSAMAQLRNVDAIWVYNSPATVGLPSMLASALRGPPHLMHVMDVWPDSILFSGLLQGRKYLATARLLERWCNLTYREASAIACTSPGAIDVLARRGVPRDKLHLIPVWTDERVSFPRPYDQTLAQDLGTTNKFTLVYAGTLGGAQGLDDFMMVCDRLRDIKSLRILIAGSGTASARLQKEMRELDLRNVLFLGQWPHEDMGRLMSISDLNLVSMKKDNPLTAITLPSKLPAILASGRAVVAWSNGEVARVVTESGAGFVVEPGDVRGLEETVRSAVVAGKAAMGVLGTKGREYYLSHFSLGNSVDAIELLLRIMAEHSLHSLGKRSTNRRQ